MHALLEVMASNAVLAGALAVAVGVATRLVRRPEVAYWLWALVLIKLVTPPLLQVPVSLPTSGETVPAVEETPAPVDITPDRAVVGEPSAISEELAGKLESHVGMLIDSASTDGFEEQAVTKSPASGPVVNTYASEAGGPPTWLISWSTLLVAAWLLGAVLWFGVAVWRVARFGRLLRHAEAASEAVQAMAQEVSKRYGLKRCPSVHVVSACIPPLLWGSVRGAKIVLPGSLMTQLTPTEQATLLAHDLAHYRRGDHLVRWLEALILGLFWWNPVAWWARGRMRQAEESCCDAWVLWAFPEGAKSYAHTLLTAVEFLSGVQSPLPAVASGVGQFGSLRRRLEMIVHRGLRRQMSWPGFAAVVLAALSVLPWSAGSLPADVVERAAEAEAEPAVSADGLYRVRGTVVDPEGRPLEGVEVYLVGSEPVHPIIGPGLLYFAFPKQCQSEALRPHELEKATTDSAGRFVLEKVPFAALSEWMADFVVRADGFGLALVTWDGAEEVRIELSKATTIEGCLLATDGGPASGVPIEVESISSKSFLDMQGLPTEEAPAFWPRPVRTDEEGRFAISGFPEGAKVELRVHDPRYEARHLWVDTKQKADPNHDEPTEASEASKPYNLSSSFTCHIGPARPVKGVVTEADTGRPVVNAFVEARADNHEYYGRTDQQGRFFINTQDAKRYVIRVYPDQESGYLATTRTHKSWPEGARALQLDFVLHRGILIHGQVVDDQTEEPIAGASLAYRKSKANPYSDFAYGDRSITDEDGRFAMTVIPGKGYLMVETPCRIYERTPINFGTVTTALPAGLTAIDLPQEGQPDDVIIRMKRSRSVSLRIRGPNGEKLLSVLAMWEGIDAVLGDVLSDSYPVPLQVAGAERDLVVSGLCPEGTSTVYLVTADRKLGGIVPITSESPEDSIEVRLQPTATITGQVVTPGGEPDLKARVDLKLASAPHLRGYAWEVAPDSLMDYSHIVRRYGQDETSYPDGKFTLENVLPGLPLELQLSRVLKRGWRPLSYVSVKPLESGELRDLGRLVVEEQPAKETAKELPAKPFREATSDGGKLTFIAGVPVLLLQGGPEEMGRQYGELALDNIRKAIGFPRQLLGITRGKGGWEQVVRLGLEVSKNVPQEARQEVEDATRAIQATDEEIGAVTVANLLIDTSVGIPNSVLLVEPSRSENDGTLLGHAFGLPSFGVLQRMSLVTVRRPREGHAYAAVGVAGLFGVISGMNETGLCVTVLDGAGARDGSPKFDPKGVPVHFTSARLLQECSNVEEAEQLVRSVHHGAQMSLAVCDRRRAVVFEVTPKSVVTRGPRDYALAVTNTFRSPELAVGGNCQRYDALEEAAREKRSFTWSDVAELLQDTERKPLQLAVFEPATLQLHVALGDPAAAADMVTIDLEPLFHPK